MVLKVIGTGSKGNSYLLENRYESLLIECGMPITDIKKAVDFELKKNYQRVDLNDDMIE